MAAVKKHKKQLVKTKASVWFTSVRGSYLPHSWQAWSLYIIAAVYIIGPFILRLINDQSVLLAVANIITHVFVAGVLLTWIAQKKS